MKLQPLFLAFSLLPVLVFSQKETAYWHFGEKAGLHFVDGRLESLSNSRIETSEGSASISDQNGNLLFYTDGIKIFDKNNEIMQNGEGLKGNPSSTQSAIIVPRPGYPGRYFLFTVDKPDYSIFPNDPIEGVHFSEIDISLNNGNGGIIPDKKNIHLLTYDPSDPVQNEFKSSEKISAVVGGDCLSYWVVTQFTNKFYAFKVTSSGVSTTPVVSVVANNVRPILNDNDVNVTAPGYMKISPDGTLLAAAFSATALGSPRTGGGKKNGKVFLYDFDDETGKVSNQKLILANTYPYGIEFSAESEKLYVTVNNYNNNDVLQNSALIQFDLTASNIINSEYTVHTSNNVAGAIQLALDGKIYRTGYPVFHESHQSLSVIHNPNATARDVNYSHNSIDIEYGYLRLGLPPFVQSLFNSNFDVENPCLGSETKFTITGEKNYDAVTWEFGDGNTSSEESPVHEYSRPGSYKVTLTKIKNGIPMNPACEEVTIVKLPDINTTYSLKQCDIGDNDPADGITSFNLQEVANSMSEESDLLQLFFYKNKEDAQNDVNNENALDNIYENSVPNEQLTVKAVAFNTNCYILTKVKLQTTSTIQLEPEPVFGCSTTEGEGEFNLTNIESTIKTDLGLERDIQLDFFNSEEDAIFGQNPLPEIYTGRSSRIYIKARKAGECYGFGSVELKFNNHPEVQNSRSLTACSSEFPVTLGSDLNFPNEGNYTFQWSEGSTGKELTVFSGGLYTVEIIDTEAGCGQTVEYLVEETTAPEILNIKIENHGQNNTIRVELANAENITALYSLNNRPGPFQESPVFENVPGGNHTIYVKDENACALAERVVSLFGFPSFFTPNQDGYNDLWKPYDIDSQDFNIESILIYDRYGKLIKQLFPYEKGWDGTFNGRPMPSDDYWFHVTLSNNRIFKGHFTLKRE